MRRVLLALLLLGATALPSAAQSVPQLPFESVPNPLRMPDDVHFGEIAGVAVNSKGHVFVFSRGNSIGPSYMATAAQLLEFDANGKFVREIGKNLYAWSYAHAVRIDKDDNIWVVDKGSDMILKLNPQGRVVWVFGRKGEASHYMMPPDYGEHALGPAQPGWRRGHAAGEQQPAQPGARPSRQRLQPADRRGVGFPGQFVLQRRLRQLARRQGQCAWRVGGELGLARQWTGSIRHPARHRRSARRTRSSSPTGATGASRSSIRQASSSGSSRSTCRCRRRARSCLAKPAPI